MCAQYTSAVQRYTTEGQATSRYSLSSCVNRRYPRETRWEILCADLLLRRPPLPLSSRDLRASLGTHVSSGLPAATPPYRPLGGLFEGIDRFLNAIALISKFA